MWNVASVTLRVVLLTTSTCASAWACTNTPRLFHVETDSGTFPVRSVKEHLVDPDDSCTHVCGLTTLLQEVYGIILKTNNDACCPIELDVRGPLKAILDSRGPRSVNLTVNVDGDPTRITEATGRLIAGSIALLGGYGVSDIFMGSWGPGSNYLLRSKVTILFSESGAHDFTSVWSAARTVDMLKCGRWQEHLTARARHELEVDGGDPRIALVAVRSDGGNNYDPWERAPFHVRPRRAHATSYRLLVYVGAFGLLMALGFASATVC